MHFLMKILLATILFSLTGCSLFGPVKENVNEYVINTVPTVHVKKPAHRISLLVPPPEANQIFNKTDMVYSAKRYEISYFTKSRWADTPPQMFQALMIETLQRTHHFRAVGTAASMGAYDYSLNTQLLDIKQIFRGKLPSEVRITLRAQLIQAATNQVVATKEFSVMELAPQNTAYSGVYAANRATARLMTQLANWCVSRHMTLRPAS